MPEIYNKADIISGSHTILRFGFRAAWANFVLFIVYDVIVFTGIFIGKGILQEPFLTVAEVVTLVGTPLLILLLAVINECAPHRGKVFSLTALGWMTLLAGSTIIVHFVNLTLWRQLSVQQQIDYARFLGWEWPSMLFAIELAAWHLFFGLSMVFAAFVFKGNSREKSARIALLVTGGFCILGLSEPLAGDLLWRTIGIFGYGVVFPIACVTISRVFRDAPRNEIQVAL